MSQDTKDSLYRKRQIHTLQVSKACFGGMLMPLPPLLLALSSLPSPTFAYIYTFIHFIGYSKRPLASRAVYAIERYATKQGCLL